MCKCMHALNLGVSFHVCCIHANVCACVDSLMNPDSSCYIKHERCTAGAHLLPQAIGQLPQ